MERFVIPSLRGGLRIVVSLTLLANAAPFLGAQSPGTVHRYAATESAPARWTVSAPSLVLGAGRDDGPYLFVDVVGIFLLDAERVVVADGQASEFRMFSLVDGRHLRTFGGVGQGPGEISDLWSAWRTSRILVAEDAAGKASVFTLDGRFLRSLPRGADASGKRLERIGMFDDTLALARLADDIPEMRPGESHMRSMQLLAVSVNRSQRITRYNDRLLVRGTAGRPRTEVFGATSVAAVVGNRACVGFPNVYVIDCYSVAGRHLTRMERAGVRAVPVTNALREDYFASETAANPGPAGAAYITRLRATASFANTLPLFGEFLAANNGDLWVGPYVPVGPLPMKRAFPRQPTIWSVYAPDGRWKADVELPVRFQLYAIDDPRVVGVRRDINDVEQVVVLPLRSR